MLRELPLLRHTSTIFYLLSAMVADAVALRGLGSVFIGGHEARWIVAGLLLVFGVLLVTERLLSRRWGWYLHGYLAFQTGLTLALLLLPPYFDFFAALGLPLSAQALRALPRPLGFRWVGVLTLAVASVLLATHGWLEGMAFLLVYGAGYLFVASYVFVTAQAEAAQAEFGRLLSELQQVHRQLQDYAAQAEELAAVDERNRLARELHDSLTQTLYSLTLQAEAAARELAAGTAAQTSEQLRAIRQMAQQALGEMRALLFELRPPNLEAEGLAGALQERLDAVEARAGLETALIIDGDEALPAAIEDGLYRIAQEALNNVLKHAQARHVNVSLRNENGAIELEITDDGRGLDPTASRTRGGMGLRGMEERAAQLGGRLTVRSAPGAGTHILVEVPR
ncbi:MAG: sensor histidine kinase [Roseiflexaceae bacterium]